MTEATIKEIPPLIEVRIHNDIGQAAMCWEFPRLAGTFDSEKAHKIADALCRFVVEQMERREE